MPVQATTLLELVPFDFAQLSFPTTGHSGREGR
ncbi:MAG: hypothetical protein KatS3mg025_1330 [Bacteroidia bacterium]|nr:MAG: hypothetical protein KatS3mg025_1330 [Bacteroidia bacterium]